MILPEPQSASKERKETFSEKEKIPIVERKEGEIPPEVRDYLTKVETATEISLPQPITDEQGEVIVDDAAPKKVVIKLPLTKEKMRRGAHHKVADSLRWLTEWCLRLVKIAHRKFVYQGA